MAKQAPLGKRYAPRYYRLCDAGVPCRDTCGSPERRGENCLGRPVLDFVLEAGEVAAGNMARLMGDHADNLFRALADPEQSGVQKYPHPVGDEGVHLVAIHKMQAYAFRRNTGCLKYRLRVKAKRLLDFRVTNQADRLGFGGRGGRKREKCGKEPAEKGSHGPHGCRPRRASGASYAPVLVASIGAGASVPAIARRVRGLLRYSANRHSQTVLSR